MAGTTPSDIMSGAYGQATSLSAQGQAFAEKLAALANVQFDVTIPTADFSALDESINNLLGMLSNITPISIKDETTKDITAPDDPKIGNVGEINVPDFTEAVPVPDYPQPLRLIEPDAPVRPALNAVAIPEAPVIAKPTAPEIAALSFPDSPGFEFPEFNEAFPTDDVGKPTNYFSYNEAEYASALQSPVITALISDIAGGLVPDEELDYNLAVARIDNEALKAVADTKRQFTQSGFSMPTGSMMAAVVAAQLNASNSKITAISDHALKMSGLKLENRKAALDKAIQYDGILRQFFGSLWERALNAAKYIHEAAMAIYSARLEHHKSRRDDYLAIIQANSEKIKALSVKADVYRTEMTAVQIKSETDKTRVAVYQAQLQAVESEIKIYQTAMEAAKLGVEINAEIVKAYAVDMEAYKGVIMSNSTQIEGYKAGISAENLKLEPFKLATAAYTASMEGKKVMLSKGQANLNAVIEGAKLRLEKYNLDMAQYKADIEHNMTYMQRVLEKHAGDISAY
ncbi:MAG: hypothetical protein HQK97_10880, partial [Nitrospirae bacterium]|nr:hypothetical protein [Nitrospirota bacterium]